ncbi:hypothetical protein AB4Y38_09665 [Paraburkholderia sp. EG285A]|uniref:hypothetical protein n=1 Tax=Paraburkholderia sp. EG285A TaxID=3237009 RepID=UPI0034D22129
MSAAGAPTSNRPAVRADYLPHHPEDQPPLWHTTRQRFTKGFLLVSVIVAIAYAALLYGERHKQERALDAHSAYTYESPVLPYAPRQQANVMPPATATGPQSTTQKPRVSPQFKDVPASLRAARTSLAENRLSNANAAVDAALTRDRDNEDAREIRRDIAARERHRDSALQSADGCATQHAWICVQRQASEALAIDSSSLRAQSLMERAILATGWSPLRPPNGPTQTNASVPLPRRASTVPLPSSHDWGAVGPTASKGPTAIAPPPPLPSATHTPTNGDQTDLGSANASDTAAAANESATAEAAGPASNDNGVDAQERAILELGWKHVPPSDATH